MKFQIALVSAAALALAACGSNDSADEAAAEATATGTSDPYATPVAGTTSPQDFVDTMAASDMFEIEAAKLAEAQGKSDKVKAFAAMMIKDHTASSDKLKAAVAEAGGGLTIAPALTPVQQGLLDQLKTGGENFDAMYAQQQADAHEKALDLLQGEAATGTVEALRAFAAEVAPTVEGHLGQARDLP